MRIIGGKNGFDFSSVSSKSMLVNANRLPVHALACCLRIYPFSPLPDEKRLREHLEPPFLEIVLTFDCMPKN